MLREPQNSAAPAQGTLAFALAMQSALSLDDVASAFLASVHQIIQAESFGLYRFHADSNRVLEVHAHVEGDLLDEYELSGRRDDPILAYVLEHHRPFDSSQLCLTRWRGSGAHAVLSASGFEHSLEAPVVVDGRVEGTINFARSGDLPPFTGGDLMATAGIAEHLGLAIRRARYVERLVHRSMMFESALDRVSDTVVISDPAGRLEFHNRNAEQLLEPGLNTLQDNDCSVRDAVTVACEAIRSDGKRVVMQDVETHDGSYIARTVRLPGGADAVLTLFHARAMPERNLPVWDALTKREQQIAELASEGLTTRQIAQRAFISENTVKQHLKRIYAKTDVNNRAELVQLIWASTQSKDPSPSATR